MVLDFVDEQTLSEILKVQRRLSLDEALPFLQGIASALAYAHEQDIVHRDIKSSNVTIEKVAAADGEPTRRAVLMDLGIAKLYATMPQLIGPGGLIGMLNYVSPEQIRGAQARSMHRLNSGSLGGC